MLKVKQFKYEYTKTDLSETSGIIDPTLSFTKPTEVFKREPVEMPIEPIDTHPEIIEEPEAVDCPVEVEKPIEPIEVLEAEEPDVIEKPISPEGVSMPIKPGAPSEEVAELPEEIIKPNMVVKPIAPVAPDVKAYKDYSEYLIAYDRYLDDYISFQDRYKQYLN